MKVRIIIGNHAYAVITTASGNYDVLLRPGVSAIKSLQETSAEMLRNAEDVTRRAAIIQRAADHLESLERKAA